MRRKLTPFLRRILTVTLTLGLCVGPLAVGATPVAAASRPPPVPAAGRAHDPSAGERFFYAQRAGHA